MTIQYNYIIVHKDDSIVLHSTGPIYFFLQKETTTLIWTVLPFVTNALFLFI